MATIHISYSQLEAAAKTANSTASYFDAYASTLQSTVSGPIGSVTGGASGNLSSIQSLVNKKISDLRDKKLRYSNLSKDIGSFINNAKLADSAVSSHIDGMFRTRYDKLNTWGKIVASLKSVFNHSLGATEIGNFLRKLANLKETCDEFIDTALKNAFNWLRYGDGRYILNGLDAILSILKEIWYLPAAFSIAGLLGPLATIVFLIAAGVAIIDAAAKLHGNWKALKKNSTEPGQARYYGEISDITDAAKKETTNKGLQNLAQTTDFIGAWANLFKSGLELGGAEDINGKKHFFEKTLTADGSKGVGEIIKENLWKQIGFKTTSTDEGLKHTFNPKFFNINGSDTDGIKVAKSFTSFTSTVTTLDYSNGTLKDAIGLGKNAIPGIEALGTIKTVDSLHSETNKFREAHGKESNIPLLKDVSFNFSSMSQTIVSGCTLIPPTTPIGIACAVYNATAA